MKPLVQSYLITVILSVYFITQQVSAQTGNTNLGTSAGNASSQNTSIGYYAGDLVSSAYNTFLGSNSGRNMNSTTAHYNTFLGSYSGFNTGAGTGFAEGQNNLFGGYYSGYGNTTGGINVFLGSHSGKRNTTGSYNTFVGGYSGSNNEIGVMNTTLGYFSGTGIKGSYNVLVGGHSKSGEGGYTGDNNTFLGTYSGYMASGSNNVFIGYSTGYNESGSNKLYIDNSNTNTPLIYGDFSTNQVGINALPTSTYALNVGGTVNASALFVNGQPFTSAGVWTAAPNGVIYTNTANVGMGTTLANNPNGYKLAVNGKIGAKEVQVENTSLTWSDFVFKEGYKLRTLDEVELFIKQNGHLPEIPNEAEVKEKGIELGEMNAKLLQKIEELTLYVIELKGEIDKLKVAGSKDK